MDDFLDELFEWKIPEFRKYALYDLEAFYDHYSESEWQRKSGFPFLKITSKEFYLQKFYETRLESYIRYNLIKPIFGSLLANRGFQFKFLEPSFDGFRPNVWNNRECEQHIGFEFIEFQEKQKVGYRYTVLPVTREGRKKLLDIVKKEDIQEIVILDWELQKTAYEPDYPIDPMFDDILVRYMTVKEFFEQYLDADQYNRFIKRLKEIVIEFQEYLGVASIPKLSSPALFKFRFEVENNLKSHLEQIEELRNCWKNPPKDIPLRYAYHFVNSKSTENINYQNLEHRSLVLLFNTQAIRTYKNSKYYRAMIGRSGFARCLITSEYLYTNYGKSDQFDYTAIVSGYLKSVEQLMYTIALRFIDKKDSAGKYYQIAPKQGDKRDTKDFTTENLEKMF